MKTLRSLVITLQIFFCSVIVTSAQTKIYKLENIEGEDLWFGTWNDVSGKNDFRLKVGDWGDLYYSILKFNVNDLPEAVSKVYLSLYITKRSGSTVAPAVNFWRISEYWNDSYDGNNQFIGDYLGAISGIKPKTGWVNINITPVYLDWKSGSYPNQGVCFAPRDVGYIDFASLENSSSSKRPRLKIELAPANKLDMKLPLPGGKEWYVTVQVGGLDYNGGSDEFHTKENYYSIDFAPVIKGVGSVSNVAVNSAAGGRVFDAGYTDANGYYVTLDHDYDNKVTTGIQTKYIHLAHDPRNNPIPYRSLNVGDLIRQGDFLGIMGDTGIYSQGVHLHMKVSYKNSAAKNVAVFKNILLEGSQLETFRAGLYYMSTNR